MFQYLFDELSPILATMDVPLPFPQTGEGKNSATISNPTRLKRLERLERFELLIPNDFRDAARRPALGRALSPDVNVL